MYLYLIERTYPQHDEDSALVVAAPDEASARQVAWDHTASDDVWNPHTTTVVSLGTLACNEFAPDHPYVIVSGHTTD